MISPGGTATPTATPACPATSSAGCSCSTAPAPARRRRLVPAARELAARPRGRTGASGWRPGSAAPGATRGSSQREVQDPAEYVELWLRDAGDAGAPGYAELYDAWLDSFAEQRRRGHRVRLGHAARGGADAPVRRGSRTSASPSSSRWGPRCSRGSAARPAAGRRPTPAARARPARRPRRAAGRGGRADARRVRAVSARLRQAHGLRRSAGDRRRGRGRGRRLRRRPRSSPTSCDRVAAEHGIDPADLREGAVAAVRTLVEEGFLDLPGPAPVSGPSV